MRGTPPAYAVRLKLEQVAVPFCCLDTEYRLGYQAARGDRGAAQGAGTQAP